MNSLKACAKYLGEGTTDHGIRYIEVAVPAVGKGEDIKVRIIPNRAAGDVLGSCTKGANLLIGGRLYRNRAVQGDFNSYLIPTQKIELLPASIPLNDITIAGAYWLNDNDVKANQTSNERHNFTILTSAPTQQLLSHEYDDTISFSVTSWKYDAERILQTAHKGRQMMIQGYLRSYTPEGKDTGYVSVTVRSGLVEMFGKRKEKEESNNNVKSVKAPSVVIQGETKEEAPI
tara:strand:- start:45 stop:737 length:693 start_codon:yes stop_codon:yes gene_type:complete